LPLFQGCRAVAAKLSMTRSFWTVEQHHGREPTKTDIVGMSRTRGAQEP
jgi:hypothetical protein